MASTIDTSPPPIVWGKKKKKGIYVLVYIPESERLLSKKTSKPNRADRFKNTTPKLRGSFQPVPDGYVLGQWQTRPHTWRPFYERDAALGLATAWLPQLSAAMMIGPPSFKGRAWDPHAPFPVNAVAILNLIASVLEPTITPVVPPVYAFGELVFGYPLMYNPRDSTSTAVGTSRASAGKPE